MVLDVSSGEATSTEATHGASQRTKDDHDRTRISQSQLGLQVGGGSDRPEDELLLHGRSHGSCPPDPPTHPADAPTRETRPNPKTQHGALHDPPRQLRGRVSPLPPEPGPRLPPLRPAVLPSQGRARHPGESHDASPHDDAQPRGLVAGVRGNGITEEFGHHQPGLARLNNGSFGSCPRTVMDAQQAWQDAWLRQPDECYYGPLERGLFVARREVAEMIGVGVEQVFLLENVTASATVVAVDLMWGFVEGRFVKGDSVLMLNFTYGAVKKAFQAYPGRVGARIFQVEIPFPVSSPDQILQTFESALQKERANHPTSTIRLAVFDHIISMPTMILPIHQLVNLCRSYGVEHVFIDGAHGIGNLDLNMNEIDADYYTSNLHKWMFAPTTAAFFHCKAKHLARLHHPIISHLYDCGIVSECSWVGTRDYSALLAVPEAIQFVKDMAGSVREYSKENHRKVVAMAEMLASAWGTYLGTPPEMCAAMAMVALPPVLNISSQAELLALRRRLREEYQVEVHLFYAGNLTPAIVSESAPQNEPRTTAYVRISHQVYNKSEEYTKLRDAINDISQESQLHLCDFPEKFNITNNHVLGK